MRAKSRADEAIVNFEKGKDFELRVRKRHKKEISRMQHFFTQEENMFFETNLQQQRFECEYRFSTQSNECEGIFKQRQGNNESKTNEMLIFIRTHSLLTGTLLKI